MKIDGVEVTVGDRVLVVPSLPLRIRFLRHKLVLSVLIRLVGLKRAAKLVEFPRENGVYAVTTGRWEEG